MYGDGNGHSDARRPLRVGLIGAGRRGAARAAALRGLPGVAFVGVADADPARAHLLAHAHGASGFPSPRDLLVETDAVCICVPPPDRFRAARAAVGAGVHAFLEWPPATGLTEAEQLGRLAEEAGVEIGTARPLPVRALLDARPTDWRPRLLALALDAGTDEDGPAGVGLSWPHRLAGALDLCIAFARSTEVQHVEAEADREGARLRSVALGLRFRNGLYAQAVLHERERPVSRPERFRLDVSGGGLRLSARALGGPVCLEREPAPEAPPPPLPHAAFGPAPAPGPSPSGNELADFLAAVAAARPTPASILDALHTLRLAERVMERLR